MTKISILILLALLAVHVYADTNKSPAPVARNGDHVFALPTNRFGQIDLSGCDLTGADLTGAILDKVNFTGARFSDAIFYNAEKLVVPYDYQIDTEMIGKTIDIRVVRNGFIIEVGKKTYAENGVPALLSRVLELTRKKGPLVAGPR